MTQGGADAPQTLEAALAVISQQHQEIERLRRRLDDDLMVRDLREAVRLPATAVSDPSTDDRDATDIAEAVGYVPKNIRCVPLFYSDQVIGVLELLDKEGAS